MSTAREKAVMSCGEVTRGFEAVRDPFAENFVHRRDRDIVADLDRLAAVLARQTPAWEPGTRQAYHALSLGFYEGELLRRVGPRCQPRCRSTSQAATAMAT